MKHLVQQKKEKKEDVQNGADCHFAKSEFSGLRE